MMLGDRGDELKEGEFIVTVNAQRQIFNQSEITYAQVVELAGRNADDRLWTVTYSHRRAGRHGTLVPGQKTAAAAGMVFNVADTSGA